MFPVGLATGFIQVCLLSQITGRNFFPLKWGLIIFLSSPDISPFQYSRRGLFALITGLKLSFVSPLPKVCEVKLSFIVFAKESTFLTGAQNGKAVYLLTRQLAKQCIVWINEFEEVLEKKIRIILFTALQTYLPGHKFPEINGKSCWCRHLLFPRLSLEWEGTLSCHYWAPLPRNNTEQPSAEFSYRAPVVTRRLAVHGKEEGDHLLRQKFVSPQEVILPLHRTIVLET